MIRFAQNDYDELLLHYDYHFRVARMRWLKTKFGEILLPKDVYITIVDAEVVPELLEFWFDFGGMNCVYYRCKVLFGGGEYLDPAGIREVQERILRCSERACINRGKETAFSGTSFYHL